MFEQIGRSVQSLADDMDNPSNAGKARSKPGSISDGIGSNRESILFDTSTYVTADDASFVRRLSFAFRQEDRHSDDQVIVDQMASIALTPSQAPSSTVYPAAHP